MALSYKTDEDQDERLNPAKKLSEQENSALGDIADNFGNSADDSIENNNIARAKAAEENPTSGSPENSMNYTGGGKGSGSGGKPNFKNILKGLKGKGPIGVIVTILATAGFTGFSSVSVLPMAINSNINERFNSALGIINPANNNLIHYKFFNSKNSAISASCTDAKIVCQYRGITTKEMESLKKNGVKFNPEGGVKNASGKFTFDNIEVNGEVIDANNLSSKLSDKNFQKAIKPVRNPLWTSFKNGAKVSVRRWFGYTENPDVRATSKADLQSKIYTEVDGGTRATASTTPGDTSKDNPNATEQQKINSAVDNMAGDLNENIDAAKAAAADGTYVSPELPTGDIISSVTRDGTDLDSLATTGSKVWGAVNALDVPDMICTIYQFANLAAGAGRMIALTNYIRYGAIYLSAFDRIAAGDSTPEDYTQLTNVLTSQDKFGHMFDASAAAQFVFMGKLTTEMPMSVSAAGGSVLQNITTSLHLIHTKVGAGNAIVGRNILKTSCNILTNTAVQIGATAITIAASIFSGGIAGGAVKGLGAVSTQTIKIGIDTAKDIVVRSIKDAFQDKIAILFTRNLAQKEERTIAWKAARTSIRKQVTDPFNVIGLGLVLTETFGLDYITQTLAGTDVLSFVDDPVQTFDTIATSAATTDYASAIAAGGTIQTISEKAVYDKELARLTSEAIALEKASANPLDINNPYSKTGSFMSKAAVPLSTLSNTSTMFSFLKSVVSLPSVAISGITQTARAEYGLDPTAENLSTYVNDEYMIENQYANDISGNPAAGIDTAYMESHDPDSIFLPALEKGYIKEDGTVPLKLTDGTDNPYVAHLEECNNPARTQIDASLFDEQFIIPEKCREISKISEQTKFFNALTTYRALSMPDLTNTVEKMVAASTTNPTDSSVISGNWAKPYNGSKMNTAYHNPTYRSVYGWNHEGVDLQNTMAQPVYSACTGSVLHIIHADSVTVDYPSYGEQTSSNTVVVDCGGGITTGYHHTPAISGLQEGQQVTAGQQIGTSDSSGVSTGAHLHFNVRQNGDFINPRIFMESKGIILGTCGTSSYCVEGP